MTVNPWSLPAPLDVIAWLAVQLVRSVVWAVVTPTHNVAELGVWYVPVYWLAVYFLACLGGWGSARMRQIRRGADFFEFDPNRRGGAWAGRWAVGAIRFQVAGEAWGAAAAVILGYGGLLVLVTVGIVWRWLPLLLVAYLWWRYRARTRPAWWENGAS
jgi:hypothetical protein